MMQIQNVFNPFDNRHQAEVKKRSFAAQEGDHISMLNVFTSFVENGKSSAWCRSNYINYKGLMSAFNICEQLKRYMHKCDMPLKSCRGLLGDTAKIRRCLLTGFFAQCAQYEGTQTGVYLTLRDGSPFKVFKGSTIMYRNGKHLFNWCMFNFYLFRISQIRLVYRRFAKFNPRHK